MDKKEYEDLSKTLVTSLKKLDDEIGTIKEDTTLAHSLYDELDNESFHLSSEELEKIKKENVKENEMDSDEDEKEKDIKKEEDKGIMRRADNLAKESEKVRIRPKLLKY